MRLQRHAFMALFACGIMAMPWPSPFVPEVRAEEGVPDAAFVMQLVPMTMVKGTSYSVRVVMENTGTATWTGGSGYALGSQNPQDNTTWGLNRVKIPRGQRAISPGMQKAFDFVVTAPNQTGLYNFQWQMVRDSHDAGSIYFGEMSQNLLVNVVGSTGGADDSQFVSQSILTAMTTGATQPVTVTMRNAGTTTWTSGAGYRLVAQSPPNNTTWGLSEVVLQTAVSPGSQVTFAFTITAPTAPGLYTFQWQMSQVGGQGFFGQLTQAVSINVQPPGGINQAEFVSQNAPGACPTGLPFGVMITMRNTGTTTWSAGGGYTLATADAGWGVNQVSLPHPVPPLEEVTFLFNLTAPATVGYYPYQWRMQIEGVGTFGETTAPRMIEVVSPTSHEEGYGSNLSQPALFAEGHGLLGLPTSVDPGLRPFPSEGVENPPVFDNNAMYVLNGRIYYPQGTVNTWCADWADSIARLRRESVTVNWSDNLLNARWTTSSMIRVEHVLYQANLGATMTGYNMQSLYGTMRDEVRGADGTTYDSTTRTVFTITARIKIEKLLGPGGTVDPTIPPIIDSAVYEGFGEDGPGGYGAEVNQAGSLIYGYNWQLKSAPLTETQKLGWWRITFSVDPVANYMIEGKPFEVPCNVVFRELDPGDLLGTQFQPTLPDLTHTVLEIEIKASK